MRGRLYSSVITKQIGLSGVERASLFWPLNLNNFAFVFTHHLIWEQTSKIFLRLGLVNSKQTNPTADATETVSDQWKLFQIRCEIDGLVEKRESIIAQFSQEGVDHSSLQSQLDQVNADLKILIERKDKIKRAIRKNLQEQPSRDSEGPRENFLFSDQRAEWSIGLISSIFTETIFYAFHVSIVWTACQPQRTRWTENFSNLISSVRMKDKNIFDGFLPYLGVVVSRSILMVPVMNFLQNIFGVPSEMKLRSNLRTIVLALVRQTALGRSNRLTPELEAQLQDSSELSNAEKKFEIKSAFRGLMKNSVTYSISDWLVRSSLFPLIHVHHRLAAQGASFLCPNRGFDFISQVQSIYRIDGILGFYKGFQPHFYMLLSELAFWAVYYVVVSILIEYRMKEADDEDDDDYLTSSV